ncbi:MAG: SusD/RagB family nutrient-binding outer membrane lipoprotein [Ilyomonas sp.]
MKSFLIKTLVIFAVVTIASCSKDALRNDDILKQLDATESVNDPFLLSSIIKKTALFYQERGYENSKLPGAVQYMERNFQGSDNYYAGFKTPADDLYDAMNILKLVDGSIALADKRGSLSHKGIFTVFRVLLFSFITDFYGDIYYSEALKGREGILYPKYDKQQDIYTGLLSELDQANTMIAQGTEEISSSYDLMFGGQKIQWQKFANSLKLRLLMRASNKLADAGTQMQAILSNPATPIFTEAGDNASISYIGTNADNSWNGGTLNWEGNEEFDRRRPAKTLVDKLTDYNDPRLEVWIAPVEQPWTSDPAKNGVSLSITDPNGFNYTSTWEYIDRSNPAIAAQAANILDSNKLYVGFIAGMPGDYKNGNGHYNTQAGGVVGNFKVSKFSQLFRQNSHPLLKAMIMNSDEVQFILAEAAAKGMITGDADAYYRKGITYSMQRWGISDADISTYLAQPSIALPADQAGKLAKIADQKWLALFLVTTETYLDIRRTQLPYIFKNGNLSTFEFPLRYRYPGNELGQNKDAYDAGVSGLVPAVDDEHSKMWLLQ